MNSIKIISLCFLITCASSCRKFVEIDPPRTELIKGTVFASDETAEAAMLDVYFQMRNNGFASGTTSSFCHILSLSADESNTAIFNTPEMIRDMKAFYSNTLIPDNYFAGALWSNIYQSIYRVNAIIEGVTQSSGISENMKRQLEGEAKCMRAFCYFYLCNIWGDVPLVTGTDYLANNKAPSATVAAVYEQIIADLKDAQALLPGDYAFAGGKRIRANKFAATALLSRAYLYTEDWAGAEREASAVIAETAQYDIADNLLDVFKANGQESILQLETQKDGYPNELSTFYILGAYLGESMLTQAFVDHFEPGDQRRSLWIGGDAGTLFYAMKYQSFIAEEEASTLIRLAELYLIRSEARARLGNITGDNSAETDLNIIRGRASLPAIEAETEAEMLLAIEAEIRSEFFTEWGHRWLTLKRLGKADAVLSLVKPEWKSHQALFPVPVSQIRNNPLTTQNKDY